MIPRDRIRLMEDHEEAYFLWREKGFKRKILVHLDAHIDFKFPLFNPSLRQDIFEARNKTDLIARLESHLAAREERYPQDWQVNLSNFIYPAMREGLVDSFYWVIPGQKLSPQTPILQRVFRGLWKKDPYGDRKWERKGEAIHTNLYGKPVCVCTLEGLPPIEGETLLDIDVDFLVIPSLQVSDPTQEIGKRKPWIQPRGLLSLLMSKIRCPIFTTVAYSVNGGYTPLLYKTLGDQIYLLLIRKPADSALCERLEAHEEFKKYEEAFRRKSYRRAQQFYGKAIQHNPSYRVEDNNYGPLFLMRKEFRKAEREFQKILRVDPGHPHAWRGLGEVALARRRYDAAQGYFQRSLRCSPGEAKSLLGLAKAECALKNWEEAERLAREYIEKKSYHTTGFLLLAEIYRKTGQPEKAQQVSRKAARFGGKSASSDHLRSLVCQS